MMGRNVWGSGRLSFRLSVMLVDAAQRLTNFHLPFATLILYFIKFILSMAKNPGTIDHDESESSTEYDRPQAPMILK